MEKFCLPEKYLHANWKVKHELVREFISDFKKKKSLNHNKRISWKTSLVLELLTILNLEIDYKNFKYVNTRTPFKVNCSIHNENFDTKLELILKGQICPKCLSTEKGLSQEEAEKRATEVGYTLLDRYKDYHADHWMKCPKGHTVFMPYSTIFYNCYKDCGKERKRFKLRTPYNKIVELFDQLKNKYPNIKILTTETEYENYKGKSGKFKISYTCVYCGEKKGNTFQEIKDGNLMHKKCAGEVINSYRRFSYNQVVMRFKIQGLKVITTEEEFNLKYKNYLYEIKYKCESCGFSKKKTVKDAENSGCPACNSNYFNKSNHLLQQWSDKIKLKQDHTCFNCGYSGIEIHAHHLFGKKHFPEFSKEIWCGIALCQYCHINNTHSYHKYAKKLKAKSTPGIFISWINNWAEKCREESLSFHSLNNINSVPCPKNDLTYLDNFPFNLFKEKPYYLNEI
ncbi:hypothetical protein [Bacillus tuaregi]|uniref:hypothetical protein n=1 Tax=Bacillus tuaregi TaxID=1816695 RepID=UPI0008F890DD|nr:hypothetical protein [Bacillus tuaregi]